MGGGGNDVVKSTNTNEIQILSAGYQKPAKTAKKPSMVPGRRPGVPGTQSPAGTPAHGCSAGSGTCISF